MENLQAGTVKTLTVDEEVDYGYFLTDGTNRLLLHRNEIKDEVHIGDDIEVFLYIDKQGRLASTMTIPEIQLGTYGWGEVVDVERNLGAFVNIGISKEILVSEDDLPAFTSVWPEPGDQLYVTLTTDKKGRLLAKPAVEDVMYDKSIEASDDLFNRNIGGHVYRIHKVGAFMLSIEGYRCFIHESEMKDEPRLGEFVKGRVIDVKEDGSLNVSLLPRKQEVIGDDAAVLYSFMENNGGGMPYHDKSDADDIKLEFGMSKSAFKRAIGNLLKENKIFQENGWTYIKEN